MLLFYDFSLQVLQRHNANENDSNYDGDDNVDEEDKDDRNHHKNAITRTKADTKYNKIRMGYESA